jgi:hypothetical protein
MEVGSRRKGKKMGEEYILHEYFYSGKGKMMWWLEKNGVEESCFTSFLLHLNAEGKDLEKRRH